MSPEEARRTVAAYVIGARVPAAELEAACARIRGDPASHESLLVELGISEDPHTTCATTRAHFVELIGMSEAARQAEFSELLEHMASCASCQVGLAALRVASEVVGGAAEGAEAGAWRDLGHALSALDRNDEAVSAYDKAIALERTSYTAWFGRGEALLELGKNDDALKAVRQAIAIEPAGAEERRDYAAHLARVVGIAKRVGSHDAAREAEARLEEIG